MRASFSPSELAGARAATELPVWRGVDVAGVLRCFTFFVFGFAEFLHSLMTPLRGAANSGFFKFYLFLIFN